MSGGRDAFIVSAVRTPIGRFLGGLAGVPATTLGACVVGEALRRAGADPAAVDEVVMGHVLQAGTGQNPARQAARKAGLPDRVPAVTINKVCGSGLKAVMLASQAIRAGDADLVVAGGMESMSGAPHLVETRKGLRLEMGLLFRAVNLVDVRPGSIPNDAVLADSLMHDGLLDAYERTPMGEYGERTAERYGITREQMDLYAATSHQKAVAAARDGRFAAELTPMGNVKADEGPRPDTTVERLASLKPVFRPDGRLTAGNSATINDGAAALVVASEAALKRHALRPMARITGAATGGTEPQHLLMAPIEAVAALRARAGVKLEDMDLIELNEAFAAQCCALIREWKIDPARVNVHGGAVALGHPIGASGARVLVTLLHALKATGRRTGLATLCLGGGNAVALSVEAA